MNASIFSGVAFCILFWTAARVEAQTNTFPSSGNAGIGRPSSELYAGLTVQVNTGTAAPVLGTGSGHFSLEDGNFGTLFGVSTSGDGWIQVQRTDGTPIAYDLLLQPSGGNVGVGDTSAPYRLSIQAPSSGEPSTLFLGGSTATAVQIKIGDDYSGSVGGAYSSGNTFVASNAYQTTYATDSWSKGITTYASTAAFLGINSSTNQPAFQIDYAPAGTATGNLSSFFSSLFTILGNGNVGIGTTDPAFPLAVNGTIEAKEVIVQTGWSDYVFDKEYRLAPLAEIEAFINSEHHLPGLPAEKQVAEKGVSLGDMQSKLLAQIEQLTLHQIEQEKGMRAQERRLDLQSAELRAQSEQIDSLARDNADLLSALASLR